MRVSFVAALVTIAACSVDDLDLTGKECPCVEGWVCDNGRCVTSIADASVPPDAADPPDADPPPPPPLDGDAPPGKVGIDELTAVWETSTTVAWTWITKGVEADFDHYEITTGATESAVMTRGEGSKTWTVNTELKTFGPWDDPHGKQQRVTPLTLTNGHAPLSLVYAQVAAFDKDQHFKASPIIKVTTKADETLGGATIFDGQFIPDGGANGYFAAPTGKLVVGSGGVSGGKALVMSPGCTGVGFCPSNFGLRNLDIPLTGITAGTFAQAYLQFYISGAVPVNTTDPTNNFFHVALRIGDSTCTADDCEFFFRGLRLQTDAKYRLFRIPLSELARADGTKMTSVDVTPVARRSVFGIRCTGQWASTGARVDNVLVKW